MKNLVCFLFIAGMLVLSEGCASLTTVSLSTNQAKPISMTANINKEYRVLKHIKVVQSVPFLFLVRLNPENAAPDIDQLLQPEFAATPGDAIVNVKIEGKPFFGDIFFPIGFGVVGGIAFSPLFLFVAAPFFEDLKTYTIEGDIVQYIEPNPILKPNQQFDPVTGLPVRSTTIQFDPNTGLPVRP